MNYDEIPNNGEIDELVQSLSDWVSEQPYLPRIQDDKILLRKFLVNCSYCVEETKDQIDRYYSGRTAYPTVFENRDPTTESIESISKLCSLFPLPNKTSRGELVFVSKADSNPADIIPMDFVRYLSMVLDVTFLEEDAPVDFIVLIDYRTFSSQHFSKLISVVTICDELMHRMYPGRFKGEHCLYAPLLVKTLMAVKPLFKPEYRGRIHVHGELDTLYEVVDRHILPSDLGGDEKSIEELNDSYRKKVQSYRDWFKTQEDIRSNEGLRPSRLQRFFAYLRG